MSKFYLPRHRPGLLGHRRRCLTSPGAAELVPPGHGLDRRRAGLRCGYDPRRREPDAVSARLNHSRTAGRGAACCPPLLRANLQVAPGAQPSIGVDPDTPVEASLATTPQVPSRSSRLTTPAPSTRALAGTPQPCPPACPHCSSCPAGLLLVHAAVRRISPSPRSAAGGRQPLFGDSPRTPAPPSPARSASLIQSSCLSRVSTGVSRVPRDRLP